LRGFPLQYQHGENTTLFTSELRYYPQVNLFKLFELGGVVFWDVGKASGTSTIKNIDNGWLNSLGIGARFFSTHSSESQVIHLDIAFPISDNDQLNGVEIRAETKSAF
jgi:hemolysin activation/secretion protein